MEVVFVFSVIGYVVGSFIGLIFIYNEAREDAFNDYMLCKKFEEDEKE